MMPYLAILPVMLEPTALEGIPYSVLYPYMPTDLMELEVLDSVERGARYLQGSVPCSGKEGFRAPKATPGRKRTQ